MVDNNGLYSEYKVMSNEKILKTMWKVVIKNVLHGVCCAMPKKARSGVCTLVRVVAAICAVCVLVNAKTYTVCIIKVADIEALNSAVDGIKEGLAGHADVKVFSCQNNAATAAQLVARNADADVIVTVGTMPTQVACKLSEKNEKNPMRAKVVYLAVTNPGSASKLIADGEVHGVSDRVPVSEQLDWFEKIHLQYYKRPLKRLGVVYNAGEANSVATIDELRVAARSRGIELVERAVQGGGGVLQAVYAILSDGVDAFYVGNDNTALSCLPIIVKCCGRVPVYTSDVEEMKKGCAGACGPDQHALGRQTALVVIKTIKGEEVSSSGPATFERVLNRELLEGMIHVAAPSSTSKRVLNRRLVKRRTHVASGPAASKHVLNRRPMKRRGRT
jgi:putative ABC transport system substrate-binding protein